MLTDEQLAVVERVTQVADQLYQEKARSLGYGNGPQRAAVEQAKNFVEQLKLSR